MMPRILTKMKNFGKYLRATHHLYFQTSFLRRTVDWIIKTNRVTISWSWMKVIHLFYFILATSYSTFKVSVMSGQLKVGYQTTAFENHSYYQVALFDLVSLQEQITCLQIQNLIIIYYWYLPSRRLIWKKIYGRVK